jgi:geranylgeranyl reductase family protein
VATPKYEVIVVGAGPAGVAVAARLAQQGRADKVLVIDRYTFPRDKPCGGALTGHMEPVMKTLGLELRVPNVPCTDAVVRFGSLERSVQMGKSVDVIRRMEFDADLVEQARELGVQIVEGEGLVRYESTEEGVIVHTSKGRQLHTRVLVGADGAASKVRKQILHKEKAIPHRLFMCEIDVPRPASLKQTMTYDFSLMSRGLRGYLWVFPAPDGRVNVGLMHYPAPDKVLGGRELTELLREGLKRYDIELPKTGVRGWPVWGYHPKAAISEARVLTVGDAAGIDGLTGEGIAVAMEQAVVAGDAIDEALRTESFAFSDYRKRMRRAVVGRELALDRLLALMLYSKQKWWREWLALILLDNKILKLYAGRVDGTEILADQKWSLLWAYLKHFFKRRRRLKQLREHA